MSGMYTREDCERGTPFRDHILSHKLLTAMNDSTWPRTEHPHTALLEPKLNPSTVACVHKRTPLDYLKDLFSTRFRLLCGPPGLWAVFVCVHLWICMISDISI